MLYLWVVCLVINQLTNIIQQKTNENQNEIFTKEPISIESGLYVRLEWLLVLIPEVDRLIQPAVMDLEEAATRRAVRVQIRLPLSRGKGKSKAELYTRVFSHTC